VARAALGHGAATAERGSGKIGQWRRLIILTASNECVRTAKSAMSWSMPTIPLIAGAGLGDTVLADLAYGCRAGREPSRRAGHCSAGYWE